MGSKGCTLHYHWWTLIHFEGFCFPRFVDMGSKGQVIRYDWWILIHFVIFVGSVFHGPLIADVEIFKL